MSNRDSGDEQAREEIAGLEAFIDDHEPEIEAVEELHDGLRPGAESPPEEGTYNDPTTYTPQKFDIQRQLVFLDELAKCGNVTEAMKCAGIKSRKTIRTAKERSEPFNRAFEEAMERATDQLEKMARKLATGQIGEPIYQNGVKVGERPIYSTSMLKTLLKAHRPEKFDRNQEVEHTGEVTFHLKPPDDYDEEALEEENQA